ncbi:MAG: Omp28-related outer membrane protein [Saprospiraceae bacterium]
MKKIYAIAFAFFFAGAIANAQTYMSEDLENGTPAGWTLENAWAVGVNTDLFSQYFPIAPHTTMVAVNDDLLGAGVDGSGRLILAPVDLSTSVNTFLTFEIAYGARAYQGAQESLTLEYSTDGGTTFTAIQEIAGPANGSLAWRFAGVNITAAVSGQADVMLAFNYYDGGDWLYGVALDDIKLVEAPLWDVGVDRGAIQKYHSTAGGATASVNLTGTVTNWGVNDITSFDATWTDGTNNYMQTVTGVAIPSFGTYAFSHDEAVAITGGDYKTYNLEISNLNGANADSNPTDNAFSGFVAGIMESSDRVVVAEEATGTWCPWCPRGEIFLQMMTESNPDDFIGIAVHNADPMAVAVYDAGQGSFPNFPGYPSVTMDRAEVIDPSDIANSHAGRLNALSPAAVSTSDVTFDPNTRELSINVNADFANYGEGEDIQLALVLTEDGVTGTTAAYDQANNYAGGGNGPMGGYESLPNPVPAANMVYNHVARAIMGGYNGQEGSLPASFTEGMQSYTFTYTVPAEYTPAKMHAIGLLIDKNSREIYNGVSTSFVACTDMTATADVVQPNNDNATGAITLSAPTGGFGAYTYMWEDGTTGPVNENLVVGDYNVVITDELGCESTQTINVAGTSVAVEDIAGLSSLILAPNPAKNIATLNVEFEDAVNLNVSLTDVTGRTLTEVNRFNTSAEVIDFNVENMANGMYFVRITVDGATHVERLIINK